MFVSTSQDGPHRTLTSKKTVGFSITSYRLAGLVIGGMIADASDGAVAALRHWLKII
ncbi:MULTISPECIES: hypothetical protein [Rhizobium]|uniref:hypothetical protein n=1 Tax=Rhizobium TaxID=379 RepID=UPI0013EEE0D5|nr:MULTISPECIES: hypothetical protein [Rhizobium]